MDKNRRGSNISTPNPDVRVMHIFDDDDLFSTADLEVTSLRVTGLPRLRRIFDLT